MMKYKPEDAARCLPAGEYPATLYKAEEKISQSGNQMLVLQWQIELRDGRTLYVKDFVLNPNSLWKLQNLATAWGLAMEFTAGTFDPSEYIKKAVVLLLTVSNSEKYGDQNNIKAYKGGEVNGQVRVPEAAEIIDPEIPF